MKNKLPLIPFLLMMVMTMAGCQAVAGIFNAGVSVGIFLAVIVVVIIIALVMRAGKSK